MINRDAPQERNAEAEKLADEFILGDADIFFEHVDGEFALAHIMDSRRIAANPKKTKRKYQVVAMWLIGKSFEDARMWLKGFYAGRKYTEYKHPKNKYFLKASYNFTHFHGKVNIDPNDPLELIVDLLPIDDRDITVDTYPFQSCDPDLELDENLFLD